MTFLSLNSVYDECEIETDETMLHLLSVHDGEVELVNVTSVEMLNNVQHEQYVSHKVQRKQLLLEILLKRKRKKEKERLR